MFPIRTVRVLRVFLLGRAVKIKAPPPSFLQGKPNAFGHVGGRRPKSGLKHGKRYTAPLRTDLHCLIGLGYLLKKIVEKRKNRDDNKPCTMTGFTLKEMR